VNYTTTQLVRAVGVTYRRLDYWDRLGILKPSLQEADGTGTVRLYSEEDLARAVCIKRLQEAGVMLRTIADRTPEGTIEDLQGLLTEFGVGGGA